MAAPFGPGAFNGTSAAFSGGADGALADQVALPSLETTGRLLKSCIALVPQPLIFVGAAYVGMLSSAASIASKPLKPLSSIAAGRASAPAAAPHMTCAMHGCTVRLLSGRSITVPLAPDMTLQQVQEAVTEASGLSRSQQKLFVLEERGDLHQSGISSLAQAMSKSLAARPSAKAALVGWVNFFFLPEVINREWTGRGLFAWANSNIVSPLRRRSEDPAAMAESMLITVQSLAGASATMELDAFAILADLHLLVRGRYGFHVDRQSLVVAEKPPASIMARGADAALTRSVRSLRVAYDVATATRNAVNAEWEALTAFGTRRYAHQAAKSAISRMRGLAEPNITMRLQTPSGKVLLSVPQGTSIGMVAQLAQECRGSASGEPIHLVLTPPRAAATAAPTRLPEGGLISPLPPAAGKAPGGGPAGRAPPRSADAATSAAATAADGGATASTEASSAAGMQGLPPRTGSSEMAPPIQKPSALAAARSLLPSSPFASGIKATSAQNPDTAVAAAAATSPAAASTTDGVAGWLNPGAAAAPPNPADGQREAGGCRLTRRLASEFDAEAESNVKAVGEDAATQNPGGSLLHPTHLLRSLSRHIPFASLVVA